MKNISHGRRVGNVEIIVTKDQKLFIKNTIDGRRRELTEEYKHRVIDNQLMDELERRIRGEYPFQDESLLHFFNN